MGNPRGRPTLYKKEYEQQVFRLCLLGADDQRIATFFDVNVDTIADWKVAHPSFLEAIKEGKEEADAKVAQSLYQRALDGDTTSAIFWLKNRDRKNWRDKHEYEHSGQVSLPILGGKSNDLHSDESDQEDIDS